LTITAQGQKTGNGKNFTLYFGKYELHKSQTKTASGSTTQTQGSVEAVLHCESASSKSVAVVNFLTFPSSCQQTRLIASILVSWRM